MSDGSGLRIKRLLADDASTAARWDAFVMANAQSSFFHRAGWQAVIRDSFGHETYFLFAESTAGDIVGVLPLAHISSLLFGKSLIGLPFAAYGGVAADDSVAADALEQAASRLARELGTDYLELRNQSLRHENWPTQDLYVTFKRQIPAVLDDKMLSIPQKRRNMVRKALKLGLHAVVDDSLDNFYPVFSENARNHGTPVLPARYFRRLKQEFGADCEIQSVHNAEGRCISSILCFYFKGEVLAYYAGESLAARNTAANDLKYWSLMCRAAQRGCQVFDLGRSKKGTGSFEFKRLWEFEPHQLHYQYDLITRDSIPQNNPMNKKYRLLIAGWKRLPLPVAELLGPMLVRNLG